LRRQGRIKVCISDYPADFFGEEEERLLAVAIVDSGNKNRAAKCTTKIVISERWTVDASTVTEKTVSVQNVIPEELIRLPWNWLAPERVMTLI